MRIYKSLVSLILINQIAWKGYYSLRGRAIAQLGRRNFKRSISSEHPTAGKGKLGVAVPVRMGRRTHRYGSKDFVHIHRGMRVATTCIVQGCCITPDISHKSLHSCFLEIFVVNCEPISFYSCYPKAHHQRHFLIGKVV
jgi:hypothetical protein